MPRVGIRSLMFVVLCSALGFAALCYPGPLWSQVLYTLTIGVLLGAILCSVKGRNRSFWLGFALIGWGFLLVGQLPSSRTLFGAQYPYTFARTFASDTYVVSPRLLHATALDYFYAAIHYTPHRRSSSTWELSKGLRRELNSDVQYNAFHEIGDSIVCLSVAFIGGLAAVRMDRRRPLATAVSRTGDV